jgi:RNA polymerase sigma-70 factor (ECF subfamily)
MTDRDADTALMLRVKAGDRDAFRELVERHQRAVIQTIWRAVGDAWVAEDLAQRVFVQVYRSAKRYQPTAKFTTWLFTIVHNTVLNEHRRRHRHLAESLEALPEPVDTRAVDPAREATQRELREKINEAIQTLPAQQRTAVILCRFEERSYEEIAATLGCSVPAVKSLLHRARVTLKERLQPFLTGGV